MPVPPWFFEHVLWRNFVFLVVFIATLHYVLWVYNISVEALRIAVRFYVISAVINLLSFQF